MEIRILYKTGTNGYVGLIYKWRLAKQIPRRNICIRRSDKTVDILSMLYLFNQNKNIKYEDQGGEKFSVYQRWRWY